MAETVTVVLDSGALLLEDGVFHVGEKAPLAFTGYTPAQGNSIRLTLFDRDGTPLADNHADAGILDLRSERLRKAFHVERCSIVFYAVAMEFTSGGESTEEVLATGQVPVAWSPLVFDAETGEPASMKGSKGDKGDPLTFDDLTEEQKASLKGDKGDPLTFDDLTEEQKASLKGDKGDKGQQGLQGIPGQRGEPGEVTEAFLEEAIKNFISNVEYVQSYGEENKPALLFKHGTRLVVAVDATPFVKDGMVSDVEISGSNLVITFNTDAGKQPISIPLTQIFNPNNYYDKIAADARFARQNEVTPLQMAAWYPDGSVTDPSQWTPAWDGTTGLKYSFDDEDQTAAVLPFRDTGYSDKDNSSLAGRVVIPPYVDRNGVRYKVTAVGGYLNAGVRRNDLLTAIIAPTTVVSIGQAAFKNCISLESVLLPAATSIEQYAFADCISLESVLLPAATSIGLYAFAYCDSLESVSLPAATSIGNFAFADCEFLESVSLPAATSIGNFAFADCEFLKSVSLPAATSIASFQFGDCTALESVDFGATARSSVPSLGTEAFYNVPTTCKIIVPDAQYDAWTAETIPDPEQEGETISNPWYALVTAGYKFLKHSEWEYARRHELTTALSSLYDWVVSKLSEYRDKLDLNVYGYGNPVASFADGFSVGYGEGGTEQKYTAPSGGETITFIGPVPSSNPFVPDYKFYYPSSLGTLDSFDPDNYSVWCLVCLSGGDTPDMLMYKTGSSYSISGWNSAAPTLTLSNGETTGGAPTMSRPIGTTGDTLAKVSHLAGKADVSTIPYSLGTPIVIDDSSVQTDTTDPNNPITYGEATLDNRTANIVQVTAATALDELRITFPAATSGKVRDIGLRVEIGTGSAALAAPALVPIAPTGETIKIENNAAEIPALADGTATAKGVTLLYFSETAPGVFVVKGEQVEEVA